MSWRAAARAAGAGAAAVLLALVAACSSDGGRPKPAELAPNVPVLGVRLAWSARIGTVALPLDVQVSGSTVTLAASDGTVLALDASNGRPLWRAETRAGLSAGVGGDGRQAAVVTRDNELVLHAAEGGERWRQKLAAQSFTPPLVAGGRVFVLGGDRSVAAFDAATGRKLWQQQRPGEPLVLRQAGVLLPVGDTLVVGLSGRLVGLNPDGGSVRWEVPIATPRGSNDVERLVDLVGHVGRQGSAVCVRAFQSAIGCVDAQRGSLLWTKPAAGSQGIDGDADRLYGTESDGRVVAWRRSDGERAWTVDRLLYRRLSAPLVLGRSVVVGDDAGLVHFLSREDGSALNRLPTDGSPIAAAPVAAGDTLVVVTRNGGVFGFQPE